MTKTIIVSPKFSHILDNTGVPYKTYEEIGRTGDTLLVNLFDEDKPKTVWREALVMFADMPVPNTAWYEKGEEPSKGDRLLSWTGREIEVDND